MNTETFTQQVPIAIAAIANHMVDHQLPAPMSIDVYTTEQRITIRLIGSVHGAHEAWLNTLAIDNEANTYPEGIAPGMMRTAWLVRLPDLGIRFELVTYRSVPFLAAVPA